MLKPDIDKLKDLIRILPKGKWIFYPETISGEDPDGNHFTISSLHLDEVQQKLYLDAMLLFLNNIEPLISHNEWIRQRADGFEDELNNYKGKSKHIYNRGLEDIEQIIQSIPLHSPTARDALNEVIQRMQKLYDLKRVPDKKKIPQILDKE